MSFSPVPQVKPLDDPRFEHIEVLGVGASGYVRLVQDVQTQKKFAMKCHKRKKINPQLEAEVMNHSQIIHPHVVQFREVYTSPGDLHVVMDYANSGTIISLIYLITTCCIIHEGQEKPTLQICDFGGSISSDSHADCKVGTIGYMAPEVMRGCECRYDPKASDAFSIGVVLYVMMCGKYPFDHPADGFLPAYAQSMKVLERIEKEKYELPPSVEASDLVLDLLQRLLKAKPAYRMSVSEILEHPWFNEGPPPEALIKRDELLARPPLEGHPAPSHVQSVLEEAKELPNGRMAKSSSKNDFRRKGNQPGLEGLANANSRMAKSVSMFDVQHKVHQPMFERAGSGPPPNSQASKQELHRKNHQPMLERAGSEPPLNSQATKQELRRKNHQSMLERAGSGPPLTSQSTKQELRRKVHQPTCEEAKEPALGHPRIPKPASKNDLHQKFQKCALGEAEEPAMGHPKMPKPESKNDLREEVRQPVLEEVTKVEEAALGNPTRPESAIKTDLCGKVHQPVLVEVEEAALGNPTRPESASNTDLCGKVHQPVLVDVKEVHQPVLSGVKEVEEAALGNPTRPESASINYLCGKVLQLVLEVKEAEEESLGDPTMPESASNTGLCGKVHQPVLAEAEELIMGNPTRPESASKTDLCGKVLAEGQHPFMLFIAIASTASHAPLFDSNSVSTMTPLSVLSTMTPLSVLPTQTTLKLDLVDQTVVNPDLPKTFLLAQLRTP
eukprot:gene16282-22463_t